MWKKIEKKINLFMCRLLGHSTDGVHYGEWKYSSHYTCDRCGEYVEFTKETIQKCG